jgi:hypothetical protein
LATIDDDIMGFAGVRTVDDLGGGGSGGSVGEAFRIALMRGDVVLR